MGSTVSICNATNIILNLALAQVSPLYYENKVSPGECWRVTTGKSYFTIEANVYNSEDNLYTDQSVVKPIIAASIVVVGDGTAGSGPGTAFLIRASGFGLNYDKSQYVKIINNKLSTSSTAWDLTSPRTIYIRGGPPASAVTRNGFHQEINLRDTSFEGINISKDEPNGFEVTRYIKNHCDNC